MKNIHNFRDIGGYKNSEGKLFKKGLIFRSGKLDNASNKEIDFLKSLGIKAIIDFFPQSKQRRNPGKFIEDKKINLPVSIDEANKEMLRPLLKKKNAEQEIIECTNSFYRDMPALMHERMAEIFRILLKEESYPVLFTCNMGKDRTGFIIAIIQWAVGIDKETIIKEYLKTNDVYIPKARRILKIIKFLSLGFIHAENYLTAFMIRERYLLTVFDKINERFGGIEKYLECCGVSGMDIEKLGKILLEDY